MRLERALFVSKLDCSGKDMMVSCLGDSGKALLINLFFFLSYSDGKGLDRCMEEVVGLLSCIVLAYIMTRSAKTNSMQLFEEAPVHYRPNNGNVCKENKVICLENGSGGNGSSCQQPHTPCSPSK